MKLKPPRFQLDDEVYTKADGQRWFVVGFRLHVGYNVKAWSFHLSSASIDDSGEHHGQKDIGEDSLWTPEQYYKVALMTAEAEVETAKKGLAKVKDNLETLKAKRS